MKVVILHHADKDSIAIVADTANLKGVLYTEVDEADTTGVLTSKPELQSELRMIFRDVMSMFGLSIAPPKVENVEG
jgi:hypothetical protein